MRRYVSSLSAGWRWRRVNVTSSCSNPQPSPRSQRNAASEPQLMSSGCAGLLLECTRYYGGRGSRGSPAHHRKHASTGDGVRHCALHGCKRSSWDVYSCNGIDVCMPDRPCHVEAQQCDRHGVVRRVADMEHGDGHQEGKGRQFGSRCRSDRRCDTRMDANSPVPVWEANGVDTCVLHGTVRDRRHLHYVNGSAFCVPAHDCSSWATLLTRGRSQPGK